MVVESAADLLRQNPKVWQTVEVFGLQLRRREYVDLGEVANTTAKVLKVVALATFRGGVNGVSKAVRAVGVYLVEASAASGTVVGNITRRVLRVIREEFEDLDAESSISSSLADALSLLVDEVEDTLVAMLEHAAVAEQIHSDEVILTFGWSTTVESLLREAAKKRRFEVIIAENAPSCEGQGLARVLASDAKLDVALIPDAAVFAVMPRVHKVVIGAEAVMANGTLIAPAGTLHVAAAARHYAKPVLACAELYKLTPIFPEDPLAVTDLGHPAAILRQEIASRMPNVDVINPSFDQIPPNLITLLLTDTGGYNPSVVYRLVRRLYDEVHTPI